MSKMLRFTLKFVRKVMLGKLSSTRTCLLIVTIRMTVMSFSGLHAYDSFNFYLFHVCVYPT